MIFVTLLLNILCASGLTVVSWIIVFIPFILMTVIVSMLLYVFGLDVASGKYDDKNNENTTENRSEDVYGIIVIDNINNEIKNINKTTAPQYNTETQINTSRENNKQTITIPPYYSSSYAYESFQ